MKRLANKVAIVTGAASGLGRAISVLFAKEGCKVVGADIQSEGLLLLEKEISLDGGTFKPAVVNMGEAADIEKLFVFAVDTFGTVDVLVNNAGIMDHFDAVGDVDDKMWQRVMDINLNGPFRAMRAAIKLMLPKGSGSIINIASVGGLFGARAGAAYTASKHALIGLSKNTGYMYARKGIRCNAIAPGAMNTNIAAGIDMTHLSPLANERIMPGMALISRPSEPAEVAQVALFLASDESGYVNGSVVTADGGWTAF